MSEGNLQLSHIPSLRALAALLVLSLRQQVRGWRLIVLGLLFLIPGGLVVMLKLVTPARAMPSAEEMTMAFVYMFIPHALAPLAALLCAAGVVRDEVEEQTLTYLLLRPLPRSALYAIKLLASMIVTIVLTIFFSVATLVLIDRLLGKPGGAPVTQQAMGLAMILAVTQTAYCGLFGIMGLLMRRSLVIGVAYIIVFEGALATFNTLARKLTVMYYFRVLALHWLKPANARIWEIKLADAPTARSCVLTLLIAALVFAAIGALVLSVREFRMKTPEGE
jgi:ABC-2 type transport system permease protein